MILKLLGWDSKYVHFMYNSEKCMSQIAWYIHACMHTYIYHIYIHTHTHIHMLILHLCVHTYIIHIYIHTYSYIYVYIHTHAHKYRGADKSLTRPTSRCILFDGENISFDASLVIYVNSISIPPIMIINGIYENQSLLSL
jgi:hypothetical protein